MVQIIDENRKPSTSERFSQAFGQGIDAFSQYMGARKQKELESHAIETGKQLFGIDTTGFGPEERKALFVESLKQQGKQGRLGQTQDFLGKLFKGKEGESAPEGAPNKNQFDPSQLSDSDIAQATALDPNLGRSLQHAKDVGLREKRESEKFEYQKQKDSPEHKREERVSTAQAEADVKFNQTLQDSAKQHELKQQTLNNLEKLNEKGVTGKPYEKLLEKGGLVALTSDGRREFAADVKNLITDIRSILGGQFSNFEFQTILNAYPSADFSQTANRAIIKNLKNFQDIKSKEVVFANQLKKENNGKIPEDFQAKVNEKVHEYAQSKVPEIKRNNREVMAEEYGITPGNVIMIAPDGEPLDVNPEDVGKYEALGAYQP